MGFIEGASLQGLLWFDRGLTHRISYRRGAGTSGFPNAGAFLVPYLSGTAPTLSGLGPGGRWFKSDWPEQKLACDQLGQRKNEYPQKNTRGIRSG
jgi:hypothetical protein